MNQYKGVFMTSNLIEFIDSLYLAIIEHNLSAEEIKKLLFILREEQALKKD